MVNGYGVRIHRKGKFTITSVDAIGNRSDDVSLDIAKERGSVISLSSPNSDSVAVGDNITRDKQLYFIIAGIWKRCCGRSGRYQWDRI